MSPTRGVRTRYRSLRLYRTWIAPPTDHSEGDDVGAVTRANVRFLAGRSDCEFGIRSGWTCPPSCLHRARQGSAWRRIGKLLDAIPPGECPNYLRNAGYASL